MPGYAIPCDAAGPAPCMTCLAQDPHGGVLDSPPMVEELATDPVLAGLKIIAAPADTSLLPRGGERGFPHYGALLEWNQRFGRDVLALLRDNAGMTKCVCATTVQ
jgi:isoamylase